MKVTKRVPNPTSQLLETRLATRVADAEDRFNFVQHSVGTEFFVSGVIRDQIVLWYKTPTTTKDKWKFFDPGGKQNFVPCR